MEEDPSTVTDQRTSTLVPPSDSFGFETGPDDTMRAEDQVASSPKSLYTSLSAPASSSEREFQSPIPDYEARMSSPAESGSFHTAASIDSQTLDSSTEVEDDFEVETPKIGEGGVLNTHYPLPPPGHSRPPQTRVYDLPDGFDQPKLEVIDGGVQPLLEKSPLPDDGSVVQATKSHSRRQMPKNTETTPLLQSSNNKSSDDNACCTML